MLQKCFIVFPWFVVMCWRDRQLAPRLEGTHVIPVISVILLTKERRSSKAWLRSSKALKHMDELFHFTLFAFRFDKRVQTQTAIASCFSTPNSQLQTSAVTAVTLWV